jgi:hypothetical protein
VSIVWLVVIGLAAWTLVSVAVGLFIGKVIAAQNRRGGTIEFTPFAGVRVNAQPQTGTIAPHPGGLPASRPFDHEEPSAA